MTNNLVDNYLDSHGNVCQDCIHNVPNMVNEPVTVEVIANAISGLPNNKVPGADGVLAKMLKFTLIYLTPLLCYC